MTILQRLERIETLLAIKNREALTVREVAILLNLSESRIRHLAADREIPHYKNDRGKLTFLKSEIDTWMLGRKVLTNTEIAQQADTHLALSRI